MNFGLIILKMCCLLRKLWRVEHEQKCFAKVLSWVFQFSQGNKEIIDLLATGQAPIGRLSSNSMHILDFKPQNFRSGWPLLHFQLPRSCTVSYSPGSLPVRGRGASSIRTSCQVCSAELSPFERRSWNPKKALLSCVSHTERKRLGACCKRGMFRHV